MKPYWKGFSLPLVRNGTNRRNVGLVAGCLALVGTMVSQETVEDSLELYELSPFSIESGENDGYYSTYTLAGTRLRTDLKDIGAAITVVTTEFLKDTGATGNESLLLYMPSSETSGVSGNFGGLEDQDNYLGDGLPSPHSHNRIRGLTAADNTRNFFLTDIPWDSYNTSRIDLQRGPNAILAGLGSPAGLINATPLNASFEEEGSVELQFGSYGSLRAVADVNIPVIDDELGVRIAFLNDDEKYRQEEAFSDTQRLYLAVKYEPKFLQSENLNTVVNAHYESGCVDSNQPRTEPPEDRISIWWEEFEDGYGTQWPAQITAHPLSYIWDRGNYQLADGSELPASGANGAAVPDALAIAANHPFYVSYFGPGEENPLVYFDDVGNQSYASVPGLYALDPQLGSDLYLTCDVYGLAPAWSVAGAMGRPYSEYGGFMLQSLLDRSVFDYKNHLIDGSNKSEYQDFDTLTLKLEQSFWNNRIGYELALNQESYESGFHLPFGYFPAITVDVNSRLPDFSENPNVGRPVVYASDWRARSSGSKRDSNRATLYAELKESDLPFGDGILGKLIGKQRFTAVASQDTHEREETSWLTSVLDTGYRNYIGSPKLGESDGRAVGAVYLGPSLLGAYSPQGANLNAAPDLQLYDLDSLLFWDSRWNELYPNTGDYLSSVWINPWIKETDDEEDGNVSEQRYNPFNYVGWSDYDGIRILDPDTERDQLYTYANTQMEEIKSEVFVWQGSFLWDSLVPIYGYRRDRQETRYKAAPYSNDEYLVALPQDDAYQKNPGELISSYEGTTESWSVMFHADRLLPELPGRTRLSLFYNESTNFQPGVYRSDILGNPLPAPSGETTDYGFLLSTLNDRLTFKANFFENSMQNANHTGMNHLFLGMAETELFVFAMRDYASLVDLPGWDDGWRDYSQFPYQAWIDDNGYVHGDPPWLNYLAEHGLEIRNQTPEEAQQWQERAVTAALENFAPQDFWDAWNISMSDERWMNGWWSPWHEPGGDAPNGFSVTEDRISKGEEYELSFRPLDNWDIVANASRVGASRQNVAESLRDWVEQRNEAFNGDAGDVRLWWSGDRENTLKTVWNNAFYTGYLFYANREGLDVSELREWRFNVVTNYRFQDGRFRGLNLGGAYRWEDEVVLSYPMVVTATEEGSRAWDFDFENPFLGPEESHLDLWVGYEFDLGETKTWKIQLNVRDVLADGDLIPMYYDPDGNLSMARLGPDPSWFVTNTITF